MKYSNKTFRDETVDLDGNQYFQCTFESCKLMYFGGLIPYFDSCAFGSSTFMFEKGAGNALEFLRELYHAGLSTNVESFFDDIRRNPPPGGR
jgi:hypothetical protein